MTEPSGRSSLDDVGPDEEFVVEFDGDESRTDRIAATVREETPAVLDAAGYAELLDDTDVNVNRIALTDSGRIDLSYSCRGASPDALGADIRDAAIQFAAVYGLAVGGVVTGLQASGEREEGRPLRWHVQKAEAEQCARGNLDPTQYVQRIGETARVEVE